MATEAALTAWVLILAALGITAPLWISQEWLRLFNDWVRSFGRML